MMNRVRAFIFSAGVLSAAFAPPAQSSPSRTTTLIRRLEGERNYIAVRILWLRHRGQTGPQSIVEGEWGGSDGTIDLYAVYGDSPRQVRKLTLAKADDTRIKTAGGLPVFEAPFAVERFNDAPNAASTAVPLPIVWKADDFQLDLKSLLQRRFSPQDLQFRTISVRYELNAWANNMNRPTVIYPAPANALGGTPVTVQALIDLMLTGHAKDARLILHRGWPSVAGRTDVSAGGEQAFWNDLCRSLTSNSLWERFDLRRISGARSIEAAAVQSSAD